MVKPILKKWRLSYDINTFGRAITKDNGSDGYTRCQARSKPSADHEQSCRLRSGATVKLYLDGNIRHWYSRGDGRGVVFFLDVKTPEEAHAIMDTLPLSKESLMDHEYIPVGPKGQKLSERSVPIPKRRRGAANGSYSCQPKGWMKSGQR